MRQGQMTLPKIPSFKIFNFLGSPVKISLIFLVFFLFFQINFVISLLISVLLHEMAHVYVAHKKGYNTYGIEIGLLSGTASIDSRMHPKDSIWVILAGPISNVILTIIGYLFFTILPNEYVYNFMIVNGLLAILNLLPIYPLDGGSALRDFLLLKTDRRKARKYTMLTSLITSVVVTILAFSFGYIFLGAIGIFSVIFSYNNYEK